MSSTTESGTGSQTIVTFAWIDAKSIKNLTLTFDASQIKEIDNNLVLDIQSLQVENFVIGENSGITVIPEQLFASSTAGDPIITWHYYGSDETTTGSEKDAEKAAAAQEALETAKGNKQTEIENLTEALTNAQNDKAEADAAVEAAEDALQIAVMIEQHPELMNTPELTKKQQAERLEAAIAAFKDFKTSGGKGYDDLLVPKVQEYTNVVNVSTWFVAYTLATEGVGIVGMSNATNIASLQALVDEVKEAYAEFYGQELTPQTLQEIKAFEFTSYDVPAPSNDNFDPTNPGYIGNATYTSWASGLVKVGEEKTFGEKTATEVTVLTNEGADGETVPGFVDQKFFILATVGTEDVPGYSKDNYYFLFTEDENGGLVPVTSGDAAASSYIAVKIGEKKDLSLNDNTEAEILIDAADPADDIAEAKAGVQSVADATKDLTDAKNAQAAAEQAVTNAQNALTTAQGELTALNNTDAVTSESEPTLIVDLEAENETLKSVAFENEKIEKIEAYAFYNCVEAEFTGTFPATLQTIEEKAFANTQFKNLNLNNTNTIDRNKDEKINDADRLGDSNIAKDAFLNTPLETMLLANTNLSSSWIQTVARNIKFEEKEYTDECGDEYTRSVNETLTTVELPEATAELDGIETLACNKVLEGTFENCIALTAIAFPAQIDAIENNAFCGDDALATITFAPENSELVWIGNGAFYHAAATTIDLSAQTKLGSAYSWGENGGAFAFADMKNLESVNFTNTKIKSLPATIFNGDAKLTTVTFYDAADPKSGSFIETLPAGIFKTNAIAVLDIAKTKITVLENLFQAGNGSQKAKDCNGNQIILDPFNETLTAVKLPAWLKEIETNALAHMHNKDFKTVEIPGSVEELGEGVFGDDKYLETVSFFNYENDPAKKDFLDGSMLEELPAKTFAQCPNLKKVYFVTYETLENYCFGDNCFFSAGTSNTADDPRVEVYVNHDSFDALKSTTVYSSTYSKLMAFETTLKGTKIGDEYYKPWTSKYGTWIEAVDEGENAVGVYTAYQDGHKIILYPAKKSSFEGKSYYKIAAYDDDAAMAAIGMPAYQPTEDLTNTPTMPSWNGFFYNSIDERTEGLEVFTPFPAIGYTYDNPDGVLIDDDLIPWQIGQTLEERVSFGNMGAWMGTFKPTTDILAKTWMALGTAIIVYSNPDGVPYIQKTNPDQKYQSTLDLANQLSVTHKDEPKDDDNNWYYLAKSNGKPKFKHHDSDDNIEFIPKGSVAFLQTTAQGQGAREFDIEIVSESEATAIGGVMDYISAKNSDAIYNLQGVRVTAPVKGQMYIQGGKKFIQK